MLGGGDWGWGLLAIGADAEELEAMADIGVAVVTFQGGLDFGEDAVIEFDDAVALAAEEVVVVVAVGLSLLVGDPMYTM